MSATGSQSIPGRTYTYDTLNRLKTLTSTSDPYGCTGMSWNYDGWGNRLSQNKTSGPACPDTFSNTFTQNNNRLDGYSYDAAGDLLNDPNYCYTYDAEGHITQVSASAPSCGTVVATYVYDALGNRVEKIQGSSQIHYWYLTDNHVGVEWNQSSTWLNDYAYLNGQLLAEYSGGTTNFAHTDALGSTRLMTGVTHAVVECDDYLPFGELLNYSGCAGSGGTTHKFTGKERDVETGLR